MAHARPAGSPVRVWLHAARPHTLPLGAAPVVLGAAVAAALGSVAWLPTAAALVAALLIQVGVNLANDAQDAARGADQAGRTGPPRVVAEGLLPARRVRGAALAVLALAVLLGGYLVAVGGWPILAIGLSGVAFAWLYTGGPWPLGYNGLGDPLVLAYFGPVAVAGTASLSLGAFPWQAWVAGLVPGLLATAVLSVNNLRDLREDAAAGKTTLSVVLGPSRARWYSALLVAAGLLVPLALVPWRAGAALALAAAPLAVGPTRRVLGRRGLPEALPGVVRLTVAATLLLSVGILP